MVTRSIARSWKHLYLSIRVVLLLMPLAILNVDMPAAPLSSEVGGPIISDTTWTLAHSPYTVVENVEIREGVMLTIEPGVTVRFNAGKKLQVSGGLIARGTASAPITFTSTHSPGSWRNIEFTSTSITTTMDAEGNYISGSIMQDCVVEHSSTDGWLYGDAAIEARSLLIDHCTVRSDRGRGILSLGTAEAPSRITNNIVTGNSIPLILPWAPPGGGIYASHSIVIGNIVSYNSVAGGLHTQATGGGIYADCSTVSYNLVIGNSAANSVGAYGGGIYASSSIVSNNIVIGNSATSGTWASGGIDASSSTVSGNIVSYNSADAYIYAYSGISAHSSTLLSNTIVFNTSSGAWRSPVQGGAGAVRVRSSDSFLYNTVVGNTGPLAALASGVDIDRTSQVHYNNLYGNDPYDVTVVSSDDISGTENYWGTASSVDIPEQIYDWYDEGSRGKFLYIPYLKDPSPDAPFPPPTGLTADFQDNTAILSWNIHPSFTTGYGYKVYYDTDSSIPPYEGTGLNEGDSPIDVGDQTTYILTGLDLNKDCHLAVTAYDNEGHESWYSNVEWRQGGYWAYLPVVLKNH
jgi:hypothetical protein